MYAVKTTCQHYNGSLKHGKKSRKQQEAKSSKSSPSHSDTDIQYRSGNQLYRTPCKMHLKTNKTTLKNTSSTFSKIIKKPQTTKYNQGTRLPTIPMKSMQAQSKHLNTPAKAKHFYMTKHPNYRKATDSTCTKDVYSIYIPAAQKKNTTITNPTSTS